MSFSMDLMVARDGNVEMPKTFDIFIHCMLSGTDVSTMPKTHS
jgi:hypothetical protein